MNHSTQTTDRVDLVIVGAGMGSGVLALLSAARGLRVVVLERHPGGPRDPVRGELLQPNGLRILDRLGLLNGLAETEVSRTRRFHFHRIGGGRLVTIDYGVLPEPFNYALVGQPASLMRTLRRRLADTPLVSLRWGWEMVGLVRERGRVVGVEAREGNRLHRIAASVVVGGDGVASPVRAALGIRCRIRTYADGYLTLVLPRPSGFGADGRYYLGRREILGLFPLGTDSLYLFYLWPTGDRPRLEAEGIEAFKARLTAIDPAVAPALAAFSRWDQVGWMPCVKIVPRAWVADGAALLGDAAHALNPHVAQGRNQALEDAVALDAVLASCFQVGNFSRRALALYERLRRPKAHALQRLGDEMAFFWNTGNPLVGWVRDRVFTTLERDEYLRRKMLDLVAGLSGRSYTAWDRVRALGWR
jgi:2-polyprenyl-6-methoxyphenol hydroxylase-like FAD-dependent oxidoreductase